MPLDERKLRVFLRYEAARTRVPSDMWQQISSQLDQDRQRPSRSSKWGFIAPTIGLCAAAAVFWLTLIPTSEQGTQQINETVSVRSRSTRVSTAPRLPASHQVSPIRYELEPETTLALGQIVTTEYTSQRLNGVTR